jgi:hypothetical protein
MTKKTVLPFAVLALAMVAQFATTPLLGDTLYLKDGRTFDGTYTGGNARSVRFNVNGAANYYALTDVDAIQFGDDAAPAATTSMQQQQFVPLENRLLRMNRPADWQVSSSGDSITISPPKGWVRASNGATAMAYGVTVNLDRSGGARFYNQFQSLSGSTGSVESQTNRIIDRLRQANPDMRVAGSRETIQVDGQRALSMHLTGNSPAGGRETDWLVTLQEPEGLIYFVFTAPEWDFQNHESHNFRPMLDSVRLKR